MQPDNFILDEATSALDSILEQVIFAALPAYFQGKTLIVYTHRLATVQESDLVLLLDEKQLLAMGTHTALLRDNSYYQRLFGDQRTPLAAR